MQSIQRLEKSEKEKVLNKVEHYVRKLAHFSLYFVVGIISMCLMFTYKKSNIEKIGFTMLIGVLYAMSDEFHQMFIPERTASIVDVGIDSCGVFVGAVVTYGIINLVKKMINMKNLPTKNSTKNIDV